LPKKTVHARPLRARREGEQHRGHHFSTAKVHTIDERTHVHPGLVVGQLQHRGAIDFRQHRGTLKKVRQGLLAGVVFDGWGRDGSDMVY